MKSPKTVQLARHEPDVEQPDHAAATPTPPHGISRMFCLINAGALLVGIVVLWTQLNDQGARLKANSIRLDDNSRLNESIAALALRNYAVRKEVTSLGKEVKASKSENEALAGSIRNITLNVADLGNDLRSDMAYFRQEQDSIFATLDAVSIMTANQNERLDTLATEVADATFSDELDELRSDLTDVRQDYLNQQTDLSQLSESLAGAQSDLTDTWRKLMDTRNELEDTNTDLASTRNELANTQTELTETRNASAVIAISSDQLTKKFAELEEALTEQIFANSQNKPITVPTPASTAPSATVPADSTFEEENSSESEDFNFDPTPGDDSTDVEDDSFEDDSFEDGVFDDGSYDETDD